LLFVLYGVEWNTGEYLNTQLGEFQAHTLQILVADVRGVLQQVRLLGYVSLCVEASAMRAAFP
jgi:hypothetical protein